MRKRQVKEYDHIRENEARAELRRSLNEANQKLNERKVEDREQKKSSRPVRAGDTVEILSMGVKASVLAVSDDRVLTLQAGIIKTTAREEEVYLIEDKAPAKPLISSKSNTALRTASTSSEIDLRGMMTDEAIPVLERYVDSAVMSKLEKLTIIHGKGTGALREAVSQSLKMNKAVKSYRLGRYGEGETGVTIVELR